MIIANNAGTLQNAREPSQPNWPTEDNGTLTPEAKAANIFINTAYIPVITPTFKGNFILTNPGNNTLPNAIAIPIKRVPKNKAPVPNKERRITPTASKTNDKNKVYSILIRDRKSTRLNSSHVAIS